MITLDALTLPPGLLWLDEFDATRVAQTMRRTLAGGAVVYHSTITGGLPITLQSESDAGWATLATVQALAALAAVPGGIYTLSIRGVSYQVMFAHHTPPALQATPVVNIATPGPDHPYLITLKLITV